MGVVVKKFLLIRHGKTQSNLEHRYSGDPDEALCAEGLQGVEALSKSGELPPVMTLWSGPALRCRQTAEILFPDVSYCMCPLSEIDFGIFKGKNADDLLGDKDYEAWLETGCMGDIPGGDSVSDFKDWCCDIFVRITETSGEGTSALVIHGGNIMAIMERYAMPKQNFYEYHVDNCGFFICNYSNGELSIEKSARNVNR